MFPLPDFFLRKRTWLHFIKPWPKNEVFLQRGKFVTLLSKKAITRQRSLRVQLAHMCWVALNPWVACSALQKLIRALIPFSCNWESPSINKMNSILVGTHSLSKVLARLWISNNGQWPEAALKVHPQRKRFILKESSSVPLLETEIVLTLQLKINTKRKTGKEEIKKAEKQYLMKYRLNYFSCEDDILLNRSSWGQGNGPASYGDWNQA